MCAPRKTVLHNHVFHAFISFSIAPGIPRNLTAVATSFDNLVISWKPPALSNGIIRNYELRLCLTDDGTGEDVRDCGSLSSILLPANILSFNAKDNFTLCKYPKNGHTFVVKLWHCLFLILALTNGPLKPLIKRTLEVI